MCIRDRRGLPLSQNDISSARRRYESNDHDNPRCAPLCLYPMLSVAQPSTRAPPLRVPCAAHALLHRMPQPLCPAGPLPKHARTHVIPSRPSHCGCTRFRSGPATPGGKRDDVWIYQYVLIKSISQRYHPRVRQPPSWLSTFESGVQSHVRPPLLTATLCPDRSTADPSCTPHMCRMQHNHPCIACRTHPARVVPVLRPEHTRTHRLPCHARTCGCAHVSGPGWRLPGCEETFFGAISTCAPASSQRCHVRVRLLPLCRSELLFAVVGSWNLESRHGL